MFLKLRTILCIAITFTYVDQNVKAVTYQNMKNTDKLSNSSEWNAKELVVEAIIVNDYEKNTEKNKKRYSIKHQLLQPPVDSLGAIVEGFQLVDVKKTVVDKLPEWLLTGIAADETIKKENAEARQKLMSEFSKNWNMTEDFNLDEQKTVDRFIKALNVLSGQEKKLIDKRDDNDDNDVQSKIDLRYGCADVHNDCEYYKDYCETHKNTMGINCAQTCGFCDMCRNTASESHCVEIKQFELCNHAEAKQYCEKTCGTCHLACSNSIYGCCPDKKTSKKDDIGSNCPACEEKFETVCRMFKKDCTELTGAGPWMKKNCRVTCGLCKATIISQIKDSSCKDNDIQKYFCPVWKFVGWCNQKKALMSKFCSRTCQFC